MQPRATLQSPPDASPALSLAVLGPPLFSAIVYGEPAPQGSKQGFAVTRGKKGAKVYTGKVAMVESSKKVEPWRSAVASIAKPRTRELAGPGREWELLDGPLVADMVFTMPPPQKMPKGRQYPHVIPDLSKLLRSTEDALSKIVWHDDARVVAYRRLAKVYAGFGDPDALTAAPGAVIRVWRAPPFIDSDGALL